MDFYQKLEIAKNPNTQPETLQQLAGDEDWQGQESSDNGKCSREGEMTMISNLYDKLPSII